MNLSSHNVLSWRLSNTLTGDLCLDALNLALVDARTENFNTYQEVQFTPTECTLPLEKSGVAISMNGRGRALNTVRPHSYPGCRPPPRSRVAPVRLLRRSRSKRTGASHSQGNPDDRNWFHQRGQVNCVVSSSKNPFKPHTGHEDSFIRTGSGFGEGVNRTSSMPLASRSDVTLLRIR
jgi:hypothetical protein